MKPVTWVRTAQSTQSSQHRCALLTSSRLRQLFKHLSDQVKSQYWPFEIGAGEMLRRSLLNCAFCFYLIFNSPSVCLDGHQKPFGAHREPDVVTEELQTVPHPIEFWEKYVSKNRPVVLRGAAKHSRYNCIKVYLFSCNVCNRVSVLQGCKYYI